MIASQPRSPIPNVYHFNSPCFLVFLPGNETSVPGMQDDPSGAAVHAQQAHRLTILKNVNCVITVEHLRVLVGSKPVVLASR